MSMVNMRNGLLNIPKLKSFRLEALIPLSDIPMHKREISSRPKFSFPLGNANEKPGLRRPAESTWSNEWSMHARRNGEDVLGI